MICRGLDLDKVMGGVWEWIDGLVEGHDRGAEGIVMQHLGLEID